VYRLGVNSGVLTTRRLLDEEETNKHESGWDELDSKRDDPLLMSWFHCCRDTVLSGVSSIGTISYRMAYIDPETDDTADLPSHFIESN
jgi:hypothetical protein